MRYWPGASVELQDTEQVPDWVKLDDVPDSTVDPDEKPAKKPRRKKGVPEPAPSSFGESTT